MRVLLRHNPGAGRGDHSGEELTRLFAEEGHEVVYRHVKTDELSPEEATGVDRVAIAGGDGTVGKAVRALVDVDRPFLILPLGTANNIARCIGLPLHAEDIVRRCGAAHERGLDVGLARGPRGSQVFLEGVGLGAFAEMMLAGMRADSRRAERGGAVVPAR